MKAGTKTTFSADSTDAAMASTSDDAAKKCMLSRSHCTTAPPTKTLPSSAYSSLLLDAAGERGDQALLRERELVADVLQQEAAGAVGVLGFAGRDAELAEERGLLVAGDAGDLDVAEARARW